MPPHPAAAASSTSTPFPAHTYTQADLCGSTEEAGSGGKMSVLAALLPITTSKHFSGIA